MNVKETFNENKNLEDLILEYLKMILILKNKLQELCYNQYAYESYTHGRSSKCITI